MVLNVSVGKTEPKAQALTGSITVGGWAVHFSRNLITKDDRSVRLEPRTMAVLICLSRDPGEVVTRSQLEDSVWQGIVVGYDSLSNAVGKLRKAFDDDRKNPRFIETIPKVGYRLIANVVPIEQSNKSPLFEENTGDKTVAILYADVVGGLKPPTADGDRKTTSHTAYRELITEGIESYQGRIIHFSGESFLARFTTEIDALSAAVSIQSEINARNILLRSTGEIRLRIGIHRGEAIESHDDEVKVAIRLEALAEPDGICISEPMRRTVSKDMRFGYEFIGEHLVTDVSSPVRAFRVIYPNTSATSSHESTKRGDEILPPPRKASLFVKPFKNLSSDSEQDYFAEGLSSDLMIALIKIPGLLRIVDQSPSMADSEDLSLKGLGSKYGIRCVLRGGVRKQANRVRVNAELVEVESGKYLWAESFNRDLSDMFAIQDEITQEIATAMDVKLLSGEQARITQNEIKDPEAREYMYHGDYLLEHASSIHDLREAKRMFEKAIRLEPASGMPRALAAMAYWLDASSGPPASASQSRERALELASEALRLGDTTGYAHLIRARSHLENREYGKALSQATRAVSDRPNCHGAYSLKASILNYLGQPAEAIELARYAVRLTPAYPPEYPAILANAYYLCAQYEEAIVASEAAIELSKEFFEPYLFLAASSVAMGNKNTARRAVQQLLKLKPKFTISEYLESQPYKNQSVLDGLAADLRRAGLK